MKVVHFIQDHHQFKYLVHGNQDLVNLVSMALQQQQLKQMEHYGYGELVGGEQLDRMIELIVHHQLKFLVLLGIKYLLVLMPFMHLKLMEHCGHGDIIIKVNWDLIIEQIIHHQFNYQVVGKVKFLEDGMLQL